VDEDVVGTDEDEDGAGLVELADEEAELLELGAELLVLGAVLVEDALVDGAGWVGGVLPECPGRPGEVGGEVIQPSRLLTVTYAGVACRVL
jgi:hypothetical protein